ncbi:MAG: PIN domain-containing protein [Dermatophilaceae bacterium]
MTAAGGSVLLDTSVAVALVVPSHEGHDAVVAAIDGRPAGLAGHAWFETLSVLTRLPGPARRPTAEIAALLERNFPESVFLSTAATRRLAGRLGSLGVAGGAVYDALVAAAAASVDGELVSRDRRAAVTYRAVGATFRLVD